MPQQDHRLRRLRITRTHQGLSLRADSPGPPGLKRRVVGFARRRPGTPDARGSRSFFSSKRRYSVGEFQQWVSAKYNACRSAMDLKAAADRPRVGNNDADEASPVSTPPNTPRNALSSDHQFPSSPPPSPETKRRKSPGPSPPRESRKKAFFNSVFGTNIRTGVGAFARSHACTHMRTHMRTHMHTHMRTHIRTHMHIPTDNQSDPFPPFARPESTTATRKN